MILKLISVCVLLLIAYTLSGFTSSNHGPKSLTKPKRAKRSVKASDIDLSPNPCEGKYWLLQLKTDLFNDTNYMDQYAYWFMHDNGFRVLRSYKGAHGLYVVEFRHEDLKLIALADEPTADQYCQLYIGAPVVVEYEIKKDARVKFFDRRSIWLDYNPTSPHEPCKFVMNPSLESGIKVDWEAMLAPFAINFISSLEEKDRHAGGSFVDVSETKRPHILPGPTGYALSVKFADAGVQLQLISVRVDSTL